MSRPIAVMLLLSMLMVDEAETDQAVNQIGDTHPPKASLDYWTGRIEQDTTWRDTVYVGGDVTIASGATLTLAPNTQVHFLPYRDDTQGGLDSTRAELTVEGRLHAQAEPGDSLAVKELLPPLGIERFLAKVAAGTASGAVFTFSAIGFMALTVGDGYADDDLAGVGYFLTSVAIGCSVGFPLGVTLVDPHDSFSKTLLAGVIPGVVGINSLWGNTSELGLLLAYVGPITSLYASEKWRKPPQACRVSFALSPTLNGGLSAVATLRF